MLRPLGAEAIRSDDLRELKNRGGPLPTIDPVELPPGACELLRSSSARLGDLRRRYVGHPAAERSLWTDRYIDREVTLSQFRRDNAYVHQSRGMTTVNYVVGGLYARSVDELGLLERLSEDGLFGNLRVQVDGRLMSRDLLDSVLEISFLERELQVSQRTGLTTLDVGGGYGRLVHRLVEALPNLELALCTDAVAESTFISEYYLRFRGVTDPRIGHPSR